MTVTQRWACIQEVQSDFKFSAFDVQNTNRTHAGSGSTGANKNSSVIIVGRGKCKRVRALANGAAAVLLLVRARARLHRTRLDGFLWRGRGSKKLGGKLGR